MDAPKSVTANFDANVTTSSPVPVPEWWLADFDITNDFEDVVGDDPDHDGVPTGDEFVIDTDPTNSNSYLHVSQMDFVYGTNCVDQVWTNEVEPFEVVTQQVCDVVGSLLAWSCSTGRVYDVECENDVPEPVWLPLAGMTNFGPNSTTIAITNLFDGSVKKFYRLTVRLPE